LRQGTVVHRTGPGLKNLPESARPRRITATELRSLELGRPSYCGKCRVGGNICGHGECRAAIPIEGETESPRDRHRVFCRTPILESDSGPGQGDFMRKRRVLFVKYSDLYRRALLGETLDVGAADRVIRPIWRAVPTSLDGFRRPSCWAAAPGAYEQHRLYLQASAPWCVRRRLKASRLSDCPRSALALALGARVRPGRRNGFRGDA
jgi:hypothetical protein